MSTPSIQERCLAHNGEYCQDLLLRAGIPLRTNPSVCEQCLKLGGLASDKGKEFRERIVAANDRHHLNNPHLSNRETLVALLIRGKMPAEVLEREEVKDVLHDGRMWEEVKGTWEQAASFLKSLGSAAVGRVSPSVRAQRVESCFGGVDKKPCPRLRASPSGAGYFCGACGCGDTPLARFSVEGSSFDKLDYPYLECPRRRAGFSNARP